MRQSKPRGQGNGLNVLRCTGPVPRPRLLGCGAGRHVVASSRTLLAKIRSGVSSVGDRGRSVQYRGPDELWPLAQQLQKELIACELGYWWPGRKRLAYVDHIKGL